ncbi:hypothetical protein KY363_00120 [Candidatus Woesearchaeota archaeon]|nr:hypothetical protein [Candidatus Woesearchaeota archaeon]
MRRVTTAAPAARMPVARPMGRGAFLRGVGAAAVAGAAAFGGFARPVRATGMIHTVFPTGDASQDFNAVQTAINNASAGDTILLKATNANGVFTPFNMGTPATFTYITIAKPLTIMGESLAPDNSVRTLITGGYAPFLIDTCDGNPNATPSGPVNFEMLDSRGARHYFLRFKAVAGANITDVRVYDLVHAAPSDIYPEGDAYAIMLNPLVRTPAGNYTTDKICGDIKLLRCRFDNSNRGGVGYTEGVFAMRIDANLSVENCYFKEIGGRNVNILDTIGHTSIKENTMESTSAGLVVVPAYGLIRYNRAVQYAEVFPGRQASFDFMNNSVSFNPRVYKSVKVELISLQLGGLNGGRIENNTVTLNTANADVGISYFMNLLSSSNVSITGNTFEGTVIQGIGMLPSFDTGNGCANNTVTGNDFSRMTTFGEQLIFDQVTGLYVSKNVFGYVAEDKWPAVYCNANDTVFNRNDFTRTGLKGFNVSSSGVARAGCMFIEYGTSGVVVNAVLVEDFPKLEYPWYDPCTQIADCSYVLGTNTINLIFPPTIPACDSTKYEHMIHMLEQYAKYRDYVAELEATIAGLDQPI